MNIINKHILRFVAALMLCGVAYSCAQDEFGSGNGYVLPPGKYPLMLTASVEPISSRAGEPDMWTDEDSIGVRIYADDGSDYPMTGKYFLNPDGSVKRTEDPVSWTALSGTVKAWFPFVGENKEMNVSIADQSKGLHDYNFMNAVAENCDYNETVDLCFKHLMAKVRCQFLQGDGISDKEWKTVKVSFGGYTAVSFSKGELTGSEDGWIKPFFEDETSYLEKPREALLVPKVIDGKPLINVELTVTVNGRELEKTLSYTEEIKAGHLYNFNITVQKDRLVVESISGAWNDDKGSPDAYEIPHRVNLPKGHGQTLTFSSNVTPVSGGTRAGDDIDYLLVKGKEFSISYDVDATNSMKGFIPIVNDVNKLTMNCLGLDGVYLFQYKLTADTDEVSLEYGDYAQVGDKYYSDGTWGRGNEKEKKPIGIVFKSGVASTGDPGNPNDVDKPSNELY